MEYKDLNDYETLQYIKENNEEAHNIIIEKYKPLINSISNKMYQKVSNTGLDVSDLVQEGMLGLTSAIESFKEQKNASFYTYAKTCIERTIIDALIKSKRQKYQVLNESISYDAIENSEELILKDEINDPLTILIGIDNKKGLEEKIKASLTMLEEEVFSLMVLGFNYKDIAEILNKEPKSIDNAIQRIRTKAKNILKI